MFSVFAHLTALSRPEEILETIKIDLHGDPAQAGQEESKVNPESIGQLVWKIKEFLDIVRQDGNKIYDILAVSTTFKGTPLPLKVAAHSVFTHRSDAYVTVDVRID